MDGGRDHRAADPQPLADMAFHLGAEDQFRRRLLDGALDVEVIVGDQRLEAQRLGGGAHRARHLAVVAAQADDLEPHLLGRDPGRRDGMAAVAEDEYPLAGQVGAVDAGRIPRQPEPRGIEPRRHPGQPRDLGHEVARRADADRHDPGVGLAQRPLHPAAGGLAGFGIHQHVEMRRAEAGDVLGAGAIGRDDVHADAHLVQQRGDLGDVVAVPEPQRGGADQVGGGPGGTLHRLRQPLDDPKERLVCAEVFLALVAGQFQRDHRHRQVQRLGQPAGIVLDQLGGAACADDQRAGAEPLVGLLAGGLEQRRGIGAQVAGLEGGVGHRRAMVAPLDHREQQIGIGVALRRVQHVVDVAHRRRHPHRADMRRAFVCPDRQLHAAASGVSSARRRSGRAKSPARSPACS